MKGSSRLLLGTAICGIVGLSVINANATDIDVTATMTASAVVNVVNTSNIDFGGIDFAAGHIGTVELGPDSNAALGGGSVNLTLTGTPTAGQLDVTEAAGIIDITCDATAIIDDGAAGPLNLTTVVWDVSNAATYAGAANTCAGLGAGTVSINVGVTPNPSLFVGAELTIPNNALNGSSGSTPFDTATGTGDPITFRIVFQ